MSRVNPVTHIGKYVLRFILIIFSHLFLGLPKGFLLIHLHFKISEELLPSSILTTYSAHRNILDLSILTVIGERYKL